MCPSAGFIDREARNSGFWLGQVIDNVSPSIL